MFRKLQPILCGCLDSQRPEAHQISKWFITSPMAENWTLVPKDNTVFSLFPVNSMCFLWLNFSHSTKKKKKKKFVWHSRAPTIHRSVHQLCESLTWASGDSRNLSGPRPPSVDCLSLCHPVHWTVAQVDMSIVFSHCLVFSNTYTEFASLQQLV